MGRRLALLGSINVGGNRLKMTDLKAALEDAGLAQVAGLVDRAVDVEEEVDREAAQVFGIFNTIQKRGDAFCIQVSNPRMLCGHSARENYCGWDLFNNQVRYAVQR